MDTQLIHIRDLIGKEFRGDPRTRKADGELTYNFPDTPKLVISPKITMTYKQPKRKPKNNTEAWPWFLWDWVQTTPPMHQLCCYSGMADTDGHVDGTYFLVEAVTPKEVQP